MKKIKILVAAIASFCAVSGAALFSAPVFASYSCPSGTLRAGESVSNLAQCNIDKQEDNEDLISSVKTIINVVLGVLALVAVVMIIVGGISYTTSQGDPTKATKARNTILYSIIGLVISLLAFAIVNFVIQEGGFASADGGEDSDSGDNSSVVVE